VNARRSSDPTHPQPPALSRVARAFGDAVAGLHARGAGDAGSIEQVREWASRAWQAADDGHVCLRIDDAAAAALGNSPAIARCAAGERPAALVLDEGWLYLPRLHRAECRLAERIVALDHEDPVADAATIESCVSSLFDGAEPDDDQRGAVRIALERRLALISGGPGTGKTTTLARLLVAFARARPGARACFAAPTGKAAARLAQSLAEQLPALDPRGEAAGALPSAGMTVHRLLGLRGDAPGESARVATLQWDLVIVDEASMLDVELASLLAAVIPPHGRLVLAGDMDQLASVEAGAVFAEACASGLAEVVRLRRNYRQRDAAGIVALAQAVRERRDARAIVDALGACSAPAADVAEVADAAIAAWEPALSALAAGGSAQTVLAAFERHRVLCALAQGDRGAKGLNRAIAARVRRRVGAAPQAPWYPGRLVMVTRNRPDLGLFNGDVGVCTGAGTVGFAAAQGPREVAVLAMPPCDDAFAITVHKSQGSEYESVSFVPAPAGHPLNTRELVYTAITRARSELRVWGDARAVADAARRPGARDGRLGQRIAAALAAGG